MLQRVLLFGSCSHSPFIFRMPNADASLSWNEIIQIHFQQSFALHFAVQRTSCSIHEPSIAMARRWRLFSICNAVLIRLHQALIISWFTFQFRAIKVKNENVVGEQRHAEHWTVCAMSVSVVLLNAELEAQHTKLFHRKRELDRNSSVHQRKKCFAYAWIVIYLNANCFSLTSICGYECLRLWHQGWGGV